MAIAHLVDFLRPMHPLNANLRRSGYPPIPIVKEFLPALLLGFLCGCVTTQPRGSGAGSDSNPLRNALAGYYSTRIVPDSTIQWFTVRNWIDLGGDGRYVSGHQHYVNGAPTHDFVEMPPGLTEEGGSRGTWRVVENRLILKSDLPVFSFGSSAFSAEGLGEATVVRRAGNWVIIWDHNEFVKSKPPVSVNSTTPAATPDKGQPPVATPQAYRQAVKVLFPVPVVLDQVDHSVTLAPTLEIRNTSDDTLGIVYLGDWLANASVDYEILDSAGNKILPNRTVYLRSTLVGARIFVRLLKPGESIAWNPGVATSYSITKKGNYRLFAHVKVAVPEPMFEVGMADRDRLQISSTVHSFDSDAVTFSVE